MARRTIIQLVDDLDGTVIDEGRTVTFALGTKTYEIDLTAENVTRLQDALDPYIRAGRRIPSRK
ncbi:histone-like nucleoid-structuring protein Lsr2 [Pseudolysinimonas sp.]